MVEASVRRLEGNGVSVLRDAPMSAIVRLRGASAPMLDALGKAVGVVWTETPNVCARGAGVEIFWLAPGEWAIIGAPLEALRSDIEAHCAGCIHHVADMTDVWARWRLRGAAVEDFLARGCSLDLYPSVFGPSQCARTLLAQVGVLLGRQDNGWDLFAERALSDHLWTWFVRASRAFNLQEAGAS